MDARHRIATALTVVSQAVHFVQSAILVVEFMAMTQSGMAGRGMIFGRHLAAARQIVAQCQAARDSYAAYSLQLTALVYLSS